MKENFFISNKIRNVFIVTLLVYTFGSLNAQEEVVEKAYAFQTFKSVRMINMQSTETLPKRSLEYRIMHKFGDFAGANGGWSNFFGLENAADIGIQLEYGITDNIGISIARVKGSSTYRQNMVGTFKYRFLRQLEGGGMPVTMTFYGLANMSTSKKSANPDLYDKFSGRLAYSGQIIIARKFNERFSFQLSSGYVHRNKVSSIDKNGLPFIGAATRVQISKVYGIIADFNYPFSKLRTAENGYYPSMGIGLEIETGGHIFQINFTNSRGLNETDYIPNTRSNWADGQFRLSFNISRLFKV